MNGMNKLMRLYGAEEIPQKELSYQECKTHWLGVRAKYENMAVAFSEQIMGIEDPLLRWTVTAVIEALSLPEDCGAFIVRHDGGLEFKVVRIELDEDILDLISRSADDAMLAQAYCWLLDKLLGMPLTWVRWAIGRLQLEPKIRGVKAVFDHVVYDFDTQSIAGVSTHSHIPLRTVKVIVWKH
jgi:hypothetical protein